MSTPLLLKGFEVELFTGLEDGSHVGVAADVARELADFVTEPDHRNLEYITAPTLLPRAAGAAAATPPSPAQLVCNERSSPCCRAAPSAVAIAVASSGRTPAIPITT